MTKLEEYYNKFNEEKRLSSRHGQVEFRVSMHYIEEYIKRVCMQCRLQANNDGFADCDEEDNRCIKILDIGAGTGRYSIPLSLKGYDVTAVELVKHNVARLKQFAEKQGANLNAYQGNALKLKKFADETFDLTLLFGPMYHLYNEQDKIQALNEAKRVTKKGGYILVAYCLNEYAVIMHGFKDGHFKEALDKGKLDKNYKTVSSEEDLYEYVNIYDVNSYNEACGLERVKIISPDGPADFIRESLKAMTEEEFDLFVDYQLKNAERPDLIGAGSHIVDILKK